MNDFRQTGLGNKIDDVLSTPGIPGGSLYTGLKYLMKGNYSDGAQSISMEALGKIGFFIDLFTCDYNSAPRATNPNPGSADHELQQEINSKNLNDYIDTLDFSEDEIISIDADFNVPQDDYQSHMYEIMP